MKKAGLQKVENVEVGKQRERNIRNIDSREYNSGYCHFSS